MRASAHLNETGVIVSVEFALYSFSFEKPFAIWFCTVYDFEGDNILFFTFPSLCFSFSVEIKFYFNVYSFQCAFALYSEYNLSCKLFVALVILADALSSGIEGLG